MLLGQNQTSGQYLPLNSRGIIWSEPNFRTIFTCKNARCYSVRAENSGKMYVLKCEVLLGQNQTSGQHLPLKTRDIIWSEPNFRAIFSSRNASRGSVRTNIPGNMYLLKCEALLGENRNFGQHVPLELRGATWSEPKYRTICAS